jgi:hypothetical protein
MSLGRMGAVHSACAAPQRWQVLGCFVLSLFAIVLHVIDGVAK